MAIDPHIERHRAWIGYLQPVGLVVSAPALASAGVVLPENMIEVQQKLIAIAPKADEDQDPALLSFAALAFSVLEWPRDQLAGAPEGPPLPQLEVVLTDHQEVLRPTHVLLDRGEVVLPVWEFPRGTNLDRAPEHDGGWHASPEAKLERLLREHKLLCGLLSTPEVIRLVVAPPGESSGYVTFPIAAMCTVAGRDLLAALTMLVGAARLLDVPPDHRLNSLVRESRKYQSVVSTKLADQVLGALWELLRGFEAAAEQTPAGRAFAEVAREDPSQIYGGLLTVLLRMVFLLYAEHRGLFPDEPWFRDNYSVTRLFERLRDDLGKNPDTIDQRFGAWASLIALFRLVFHGGGHGKVHLPARHGELFDPSSFPFLEGALVAHDQLERFEVPRVSDGCIQRVLESLLVLDGERLSYRALDVEQIGSVYEAMMGFSVERAVGRSLAVKPDHVVVDMDALLEIAPGDRVKKLKELSACDPPAAAVAAIRAAGAVEALVEALGSRVSPRTPRVLPAGSLFLQPGEERRRSGSHYTPRELTHPIVETTLRPILEQLGKDPLPDQILGLKICDPAMGSGAFLVEACRQLAGHLVDSWEWHKNLPKLPPDEDKVLFAQRLVAQRCLYGVDKNPFAARLAKLSIWLVTLARDHAFTFIDHALKHGDSLVGLTRKQIARFDFAPESDDGPLFAKVTNAAQVASKLRAQIGADHEGAEDRQRLDLKEADEVIDEARLIGDLACLAFFSGDKPKARRVHLVALRDQLSRARAGDSVLLAELNEQVKAARDEHPPLVPFHWEIEFPEVFDRALPGFDAIVGNPPFMGGAKVSNTLSDAYRDWLLSLHVESHGNADLVAHFFRRAFYLIRAQGTLGLIATNTISQGDTRSTGLRYICSNGGAIFKANRRYKWPLPGASVIVSIVHVTKGSFFQKPILDGRPVSRISAFLFHRGGDEDPRKLRANESKSFKGVFVFGLGFTFDDSGRNGEANTLDDMKQLEAENPGNRQRIRPYLGGEELNDSPTQEHRRYVINFEDLPEEEARAGWPDLMAVLEARVKPMRLQDKRASYRKWWWHFAEKRSELSAALLSCAKGGRVLACVQTSKYRSFAFIPASRMVFDQKLVVFLLDSSSAFAVLSSRAHERWALFFGSTMKDDPVYTPSDCFETFPFPIGWASNSSLEEAGSAYYNYRASLMVDNDEGLTKTYNRFHTPGLDLSDPRNRHIPHLRELHAAMDRAVLDAYGWTDIPADCVFELEYEIDEKEYENKKKPWRYRWPAQVREEVLARLLELNKKRAEEERLNGASIAAATEARSVSASAQPTLAISPRKVKRTKKPVAPHPELPGTRATEAGPLFAKVLPFPKRSAPTILPWDANLLVAAGGLATVSLGAENWSTALPSQHLGLAALASVLRSLEGPAPHAKVIQAFVRTVMPTLVLASLPTGLDKLWRKAVGSSNLSIRSISTLGISWKSLIITAEQQGVLTVDKDSWQAGSAVNDASNAVLYARALVVASCMAEEAAAEIDPDIITQIRALDG